jgi:hypothetical protein
MRVLIVLGVCGLSLIGLTTSHADIAPTIAKLGDIARNWCGTFRWRGESDVQKMGILLKELKNIGGGRIEGRGMGLTRSGGRRFKVTVVFTFNKDTSRFTYRESRPIPDSLDFTTDGVAVGKISANLRSISAVWTQNKTSDTGDLVLKARAANAPLDQDCHRPGV